MERQEEAEGGAFGALPPSSETFFSFPSSTLTKPNNLLQLSYLSHSLTTSSHRTSTLLTRLSSSSTSLTTRAELSRLHQLTRSTSDTLDQLAVEREETGSTLGRLGEERERTEEEVEGWVLEWVLGWEERRRDAKKRRVGLYK